MLLSYKYRIEPNRSQTAALAEMLADFCGLYNAGLQQRIEAYRRRGVSVTYNMQAAELKAVREAAPELARWSFSAEQQCLRRLDKTYKAFFRRRYGFPRFRASARYHAAEFRVGNGLTIRKSGRLGFVGIDGEIKVCWHRNLPSDPNSAILTRQCGKWYVVFHVEVEPVPSRTNNGESVGIDFGIRHLATLSTGEPIARPNWTKRAKREIRRRQRALARCKRGSNTRAKRPAALARLHERIANKRRDHLHKVSRDLVRRFGWIAIERLNVKELLSQPYMARDISDASWGQLAAMLAYKAENAGCEFIAVDPQATSQTCPGCMAVSEKKLSRRIHRCPCGGVLDRDVAAAMVVHHRAFNFWPGAGHGALSETDASKLAPEAVCFS